MKDPNLILEMEDMVLDGDLPFFDMTLSQTHIAPCYRLVNYTLINRISQHMI